MDAAFLGAGGGFGALFGWFLGGGGAGWVGFEGVGFGVVEDWGAGAGEGEGGGGVHLVLWVVEVWVGEVGGREGVYRGVGLGVFLGVSL